MNGDTLLRLAREAIETSFAGGEVTMPEAPWLLAPGAAFVTLYERRSGELRGCVGSIESRGPLGAAVVAAARAAAFRDPRFAPLAAIELAAVRLDISVLSPLSRVTVADEAAAMALLERERPGVVLRSGRRQSVLLPKVWESIHESAVFLRHLKLKAGLPPDFWSADLRLEVFTCEEFAEPDETAPRVEAS